METVVRTVSSSSAETSLVSSVVTQLSAGQSHTSAKSSNIVLTTPINTNNNNNNKAFDVQVSIALEPPESYNNKSNPTNATTSGNLINSDQEVDNRPINYNLDLVEELQSICPNNREEANGSFMDISAVHPVVKSFIVGSISGTCSTVIFQPLDLLKTRLQHPVGRTTNYGMFGVVGHIVRDEKLLGLWKGMTPSLTRCVPGVGLYFGSIHTLKIVFDIKSEPTALQAIALGATARSISGVTMIPFTVIKTRFESKVYQYGSIREALTLIYKGEGLRGLTCGLLPTLLRDAPFSALYLMMYTWTKKQVPKDWIDSGPFSSYVRFSCGITAGVGASLVTQPFDVVKTKMQLFPDKFHSIPPVIKYIYDKYGMRGYFKGLLPRMVRRTLIAAMSWTVYEQVMRNLGLK